uniref:Uncharacterized protein n=1 Tax=Aotus nancymaae TaxID=37293 RepID=A0A2K5D9R6_AOTNA
MKDFIKCFIGIKDTISMTFSWSVNLMLITLKLIKPLKFEEWLMVQGLLPGKRCIVGC